MAQLYYTIEEIDTQITELEILHTFCDYLDERMKEIEPDLPSFNRESRIADLRHGNPHEDIFRWIVWDEHKDRIIGSADLYLTRMGSPAYEKNKHTGWGSIGVHKDYRLQGIGTQLMRAVIPKLIEQGRTIFMGGSNEPDGMNWVDHIGIGTIALVEYENRLYMNQVNWDLMEQWVADGPHLAPGVTLKTFSRMSDALIDRYASFMTKALNSVPKEDLEWEAVITPEVIRNNEERTEKLNEDWISFATVEENGDFSGMTEIFYPRVDKFLIWQGLTAVLEEYRGKKLGKWLKASAMLYIRDHYPDVKFIQTENANVNDAMLGINTKMGFKLHKQRNEYKFTIDELKDKFLDI
ncbi:MAG: GNAT family N-acetyltransferase [Candidatus Heimdallarchaeota archaeon]|nr:GNAT family N-acetyltransferase [Candidatus Heimdallarchaeota archaeon]